MGMALFSRLCLSVRVEGDVELAAGTLYVVTHRSDLDPPLVCGALYPRARRAPDERLPYFVVREDLLEPGFFAHFAPGLLPLRFGIGGVLSHMRCVALRPATRMRLVDVARRAPSLPVARVPYAPAFRDRARERGWAPPRTLHDVLRSGYADLLWRLVERSELPQPAELWAARAGDARRDLERVVALMRAGRSLVLWPVGTPSRDGSLGPIMRGVGLLVRRGRPRRIVPIGLAYDPLPRGRTRATVRVGEAVSPPVRDVEAAILALLRGSMPRSAGAALAHAYCNGTVSGPAPAPPEVLERLSREYESVHA
jgi:1-acyl-sn-glycerol-3-phosphate acyltransferase